jgi:hypothetical protein
LPVIEDLIKNRRGLAFAALLTVASVCCSIQSPRATAAGPFEPNDTISSAAGPLGKDRTYTAALEAVDDRDFYFFYAASKSDTQVSLTVRNDGGGTQSSEFDVRVVNAVGTFVGGDLAYIIKGEGRTSAFSLKPGKYFLEVVAKEGSGDAYSISTAGSEGAFADYGLISSRCEAADASVRARRDGLERAEARLERAVGRIRRTRYASLHARKAARAGYARAKAGVAAKRRALRAAIRSRAPWCFIPE